MTNPFPCLGSEGVGGTVEKDKKNMEKKGTQIDTKGSQRKCTALI